MPKWEYITVEEPNMIALSASLGNLGSKRWELVSVVAGERRSPSDAPMGATWVAILKRPLLERVDTKGWSDT